LGQKQERIMNKSNGTDHETALMMALGVLADSMESKLAPYKDTVIVLTDGEVKPLPVHQGDDHPDTELSDRIKGHWADVCQDNRSSTWYFMWDIKIIKKGYATRDEAEASMIAHIRWTGLEVPDDLFMDGGGHDERIHVAPIGTGGITMNRSNGTDNETALKIALGVLVDGMENKLAPYNDTVVILTDGLAPSAFTKFPNDSVKQNHQSEQIAVNIMAILKRTGIHSDCLIGKSTNRNGGRTGVSQNVSAVASMQ